MNLEIDNIIDTTIMYVYEIDNSIYSLYYCEVFSGGNKEGISNCYKITVACDLFYLYYFDNSKEIIQY